MGLLSFGGRPNLWGPAKEAHMARSTKPDVGLEGWNESGEL